MIRNVLTRRREYGTYWLQFSPSNPLPTHNFRFNRQTCIKYFSEQIFNFVVYFIIKTVHTKYFYNSMLYIALAFYLYEQCILIMHSFPLLLLLKTVTLCHLYCVFTYIHPLLIEEDLSECWNIMSISL